MLKGKGVELQCEKFLTADSELQCVCVREKVYECVCVYLRGWHHHAPILSEYSHGLLTGCIPGLPFTRGAHGGEGSGPNLHLACKPERQRHTSRETHDLHDSEGSVCECEQPYSDYRDGQISPAMAAQREPYLPVLYPWRRERETETEREGVCMRKRGRTLTRERERVRVCVCVCVCVYLCAWGGPA